MDPFLISVLQMRFDEAMLLLFSFGANLFGVFPAAAQLTIMLTSQMIIICA